MTMCQTTCIFGRSTVCCISFFCIFNISFFRPLKEAQTEKQCPFPGTRVSKWGPPNAHGPSCVAWTAHTNSVWKRCSKKQGLRWKEKRGDLRMLAASEKFRKKHRCVCMRSDRLWKNIWRTLKRRHILSRSRIIEECGRVFGDLVFVERQSNAQQSTNEQTWIGERTDALEDLNTIASSMDSDPWPSRTTAGPESGAEGPAETQCPKKVNSRKGREAQYGTGCTEEGRRRWSADDPGENVGASSARCNTRV